MDDLTIEYIANQCSVYLVSYGIHCEVDCDLSKSAIDCFEKLDQLQPHQFAQMFKAAKKKNPDILSYNKAMHNYENQKAWLAAALKEINPLEAKGVWVECLKSEAGGEPIVP